MNTQCDRIANHLQKGRSLTPLSALRLFDCFRLAPRILQLKQRGMRIESEMVKLSSGKKVAQYRLAP